MKHPVLTEYRLLEEITKEMLKKILKINQNDDTAYWNLWHKTKSMLRGRLMATSACNEKLKRLLVIYITLHLKNIEKKEQTKTQINRGQEIIKIREK